MTERRTDPAARDRVQEVIDEATYEAARGAAIRVGAIVFFALLSLFVGATIWQRNVNHRVDRAVAQIRATNDRLDRAEMRACERLQAQRERTNVSEARQFLLLHAVTLSPTASPQVKRRFGTLERTTVYDPPTDCGDAVLHPNTYRRPGSVSFSRLPQPYAEAVVKAAKDHRPQPTP